MREDVLQKMRSGWLILFTVFSLCLALCHSSLRAQELTKITGAVYDSVARQPLQGVNVYIKNTGTGTVTGLKGEYSLNARRGDTIVFSFIGFTNQQFVVADKSAIDVYLTANATQLNEVVAIGYGTQSKATVTGSVSSVQGDELKRSPAVNIATSLQGLLPGTMALQSSGEPGRGDPTVYVRGMSTTGNNAPLVVVDGVPNAPGWQYINSNDIASISVLKDASAAIYGARAANGVILITTKRGGTGKPSVTYSFNQAFNVPTMVPKVANAAEYAGYVNQLSEEDGQPPIFTPEQIEKFRTGSDPEHYPDVNWFKAITKDFAPQSQHNLSVRGGNEQIKFSASASYSSQGSMFKNGSLDFKTYAIRANLDAKINDYIRIGLDVNGGINDGNYPAYSTGAIFQGILQQVPWHPVYYPNGLPFSGIERGENPAIEVSSKTGNTNDKEKLFTGKASVDLSIPWVDGLSVNGFFAYTDNNRVNKNWQTPWTVYDYDSLNGEYIAHTGGGILLPQLRQSYNSGIGKLLNLRINYNGVFGNNTISAFIAGEQEEDISSNFSAFRRDFISASIDELFAGSPNNQQATGSKAISGRQSLFGRLSYGYSAKYLLDINFRYDGSSNFPTGKKFGFFPGVSVAWRISEEKFMQDISFMDNLKLRGSYGQIGNDRINPFQYLTLYTINSGYSFGNPGSLEQGLQAGVTPNPDVTWEVARISNIGLDASLWNGGLGFSVDVFKQKRSNILTTRFAEVPVFTGLALPSENIGVVENKGIEFQASSRKVIGKITYQLGANISYQKSKVIDLSEPPNIPEWQRAEGHVLGASTYYQAVGIFRTDEEVAKNPVYAGTKTGDLQYQDTNGDGKITAEDMVIEDRTNIPRLSYGFNFLIQYNRFSLWANFAGYGDVWQFYHLNARNAMNSLAELINNRYTPGSMDSKYPRLPTIESANSGEVSGLKSTFWLMNTSYLRLKTLELGYDFSSEMLSKVNIKALRIYVNANNMLTFSKFKLFDPANTQNQGYYYPLMAVYNLGLSVNF